MALNRLLAEAIGTGLLIVAVVGSGIMAQKLAPGQTALILIIISVVTAATLGPLIVIFGPISGSHFNPVVTLVDAACGGVDRRQAAGYVLAQFAGGIAGTLICHWMFDLSTVQFTGAIRSGGGQWLGEIVATSGLILIIRLLVDSERAELAPIMVPGWILGAIVFTSSTCFANPAVTVARAFTGSITGIAWSSVPMFVLCQLVGGGLGLGLSRVLRERPAPDPRP
ncbi:aquaporin family protein [Pseudonocardiaceae bacterium YIM PH 21723]|nr:aquaporin family protein [Pseudonocardiaceae bacterium YIM PH 21723]